MTDRTVPTEPTWKTVPEEPTPEMIAAFWRQKNNGTQEIGTTGDARSDYDAYRAMLAASPAAPGAEVEPVAWISRNALPVPKNALAIFAPVKREEYAVPLYPSPPTTDAIRAQARREAMEGFIAIVERNQPATQDMFSTSVCEILGRVIEGARILVGKPGEAE